MTLEEALGGEIVEADNIFAMEPIQIGAIVRLPEFARGGWERGDPGIEDCLALFNAAEPEASAERFAQVEAAMPTRRDEFSRWALPQFDFLPSLGAEAWITSISSHLWRNHGIGFREMLKTPAFLVAILHRQAGRRGLKAGSKN